MSAPAHIARANGMKGGRPKGRKNNKTLLREDGQKRLEQRYLRVLDKLANAQIGLGLGSQYLFKLPKGQKKPELVTDPGEIAKFLEGRIEQETDDYQLNDVYYFMTAKDPENSAIESAYNRSVGKPKDTVEHTGTINFSLLTLAQRAEEREKLEKSSQLSLKSAN